MWLLNIINCQGLIIDCHGLTDVRCSETKSFNMVLTCSDSPTSTNLSGPGYVIRQRHFLRTKVLYAGPALFFQGIFSEEDQTNHFTIHSAESCKALLQNFNTKSKFPSLCLAWKVNFNFHDLSFSSPQHAGHPHDHVQLMSVLNKQQ